MRERLGIFGLCTHACRPKLISPKTIYCILFLITKFILQPPLLLPGTTPFRSNVRVLPPDSARQRLYRRRNRARKLVVVFDGAARHIFAQEIAFFDSAPTPEPPRPSRRRQGAHIIFRGNALTRLNAAAAVGHVHCSREAIASLLGRHRLTAMTYRRFSPRVLEITAHALLLH